MDTPSWTDEHARLTAETAPPVPPPDEADADRIWNLVAPDLVAVPARRNWHRTSIGAGVAAVVLGTSGIAAAQMLSARTGEYNTSKEGVRLGGPGEFIDPRGAGFEDVVVEVVADIPFPSKKVYDLAVAAQLEEGRNMVASMKAAQAQGREDWKEELITGGMRAEAARVAICAWANEWAAATKAGDAEGRAEATRMLQAAPSWPAVKDVDAKQAYTWRKQMVRGEDGVTREERYLDETPFAWLPAVAAAATGESLQAVAKPLRKGQPCTPELMPDLPSAVPGPGAPR